MLHILFVILKILAIIIASILGLLLFLLLIVLFVPIRYQVYLKKQEEFIIKARANWLLRIVFVRAWFINQQLHLKLRVFGICLYDNLRPEKEKKPEKSSPSLKRNKFKKHEKSSEIPTSDNDESLDRKVAEIKTDIKTDIKTSMKTENQSDNNIVSRVEKTEIQKTEVQKSEVQKTAILKIEPSGDETKIEEVKKTKVQKIEIQKTETLVDVKKAETQIVETKTLETQDTELPNNDTPNDDTQESEEKPNKITAFFRNIRRLGKKIVSVFANMKAKMTKLGQVMKNLWFKKNLIMEFLRDEINKAGIKITLHQIWKVLKHCAPKKISGYIRYGTGDPCSTGETFAVAALFYGKYGKSLMIEPVFDEEVLEAEVMVKGRIRIFTLLIIGIRLIRDKNFSKLLKNAKQLKEEL